MSDVEHDALSLPDYDHHTTGSLEAHLPGLGSEAIEALIAYERAHGGRVPMLNVLERRLEALRGGAEPTEASEAPGPGPETADGGSGGSKVDASTSGPPLNPPSHGDPTNPAQPRT